MAEQDIFGLQQKAVAALLARGDTFEVRVGNSQGEGQAIVLAQNVSVGYNRPLQEIFELGTPFVSMTTGRPQGVLQIARVIGKKPSSDQPQAAGGVPGAPQITLMDILGKEFYEISEESTGGILNITPLGGKGLLGQSTDNMTLVASGCFVTGEQMGGAAQDVVIIESVQIQFIKLEKKG